MSGRSVLAGLVGCLGCLAVAGGCTNNPYPDADRDQKVLYSSFHEAPKTLDPAVAYSTAEHVVTGNVFDTLLEYHYLERPYRLIPGLAEAVPEPQPGADGRQVYRFRIRPDVRFHDDPCFALDGKGRTTREVTAADFAFAAGTHRRPRRQQSRHLELRAGGGLCSVRQAARRDAQVGASLREPARARAVQARRRHCGRGRAQRARPRHRPRRAQRADPLLVRHALHHAGRVGGGRLLQRPRGPRALRRSPRRHRPLPARPLREAVPVHAGAQSRLVRCLRGQPRGAGRRLPRQHRQGGYRRRTHRPRLRRPAHAVRRSRRVLPRARGHPPLQQVPAGLLRRRRHHQGKLRCGGPGRPPVAADGGARHAPRQGGGAHDLLRRVQHGGPGAGHAGGREGPQAAPGHEHRHRFEALSRAVPQRPRRAGTGTGAAGDLRLRRELQEPVPPVRRRPRPPAAGGGRLPQRHRSQDRAAAAAELRHLGDDGRGEPAVPVPGRRLARDRPRHRGQRHHLQPIPGQGAARRLPDLHLGLAGRLPRPREFPVPARVRGGALQERRARTRPTSAIPSSTASTAR